MKKLVFLIVVALGLYGCQTIVNPIGTAIETIKKPVNAITEKIIN